MKTKIITIDDKPIIVGIDENGQIIAEHYRGDPQPPTPGSKQPPVGIRDLIKLSDWIQSQGHERGSDEYNRLFNEHRGDLPLEANDFKDLR